MTTQNLPWQELFTTAMLELDPTRLEQKIKTAKVAIEERLRDLAVDVQGGRTNEARQLRDAVLSLRSIEKTELRNVAVTSVQREQTFEGPSI
jgi:hypothetical protein